MNRISVSTSKKMERLSVLHYKICLLYTSILAMERGAVEFVPKPSNIIEAKGNPFKEQLLGVLRAVFETQQNVHRMPDIKPVTGTQPVRTPARVSHNVSGDRLIALACSTGGPKSLQSVIPFLPKEMNAPMVLVPHMPAGFTKTMADRLNAVSYTHLLPSVCRWRSW